MQPCLSPMGHSQLPVQYLLLPLTHAITDEYILSSAFIIFPLKPAENKHCKSLVRFMESNGFFKSTKTKYTVSFFILINIS